MSLKSGVKWVVGELYNRSQMETKVRRLDSSHSRGEGGTTWQRRLAPRAIDQGCEPSQFFEPCRSLQLCPVWCGGGVAVERVRSEPRSCSSLLRLSHFFVMVGRCLSALLPEGTTPRLRSHCDWIALDFQPVTNAFPELSVRDCQMPGEREPPIGLVWR